jgi:DNA repair photolyase
MMSGVTDPYQPVEAKLRITRGCLEVLAACRQPVSVITKNHLITRDLDLLVELARHRAGCAAISMTTLDPKLARVMEPRTSRPADRLAALRALSEAGVPVSVMVAPVIPGLNDREIPALLEAAAAHGACSAGWVMLRLPHGVKEIFLEWLARHFPDRAAAIEQRIRDMRGGGLYESSFGRRGRGQGPLAQQIAATFDVFARRHGLDGERDGTLSSESFRRPALGGQLGLFA